MTRRRWRRDQGAERPLIDDLHVAYGILQAREVEIRPSILVRSSPSTTTRSKTCPTSQQLRHLKLPGTSVILGGKGERFTEVYARTTDGSGAASAIPDVVRNAFIAAEDKRFCQHAASTSAGWCARLSATWRSRAGRRAARRSRSSSPRRCWLETMSPMSANSRDHHRLEYRAHAEQDRDSRALSQLDLSRTWAWGVEMAARSYFGKPARRCRLWKARCWPAWPRVRTISTRTAIPRARATASNTFLVGWPKTIISTEEARSPLPQIVAYERTRQDSASTLSTRCRAKPRHSPASARSTVVLCGAHDHQSVAAARHRIDFAGRPCAIRIEYRPLQVSERRGQSLRRRPDWEGTISRPVRPGSRR